MPVWEIKEPLGVTPAPVKPIKKEIGSVTAVTGIKAVDRLFAGWDWRRGGKRRHQHDTGSKASIRKIRILAEHVNANLTACGIRIHLVLTLDHDVWGLDIYDCSDNWQCRIIHAVAIDLDELTGLLTSLQREAGIMLDKVL
ncbi:MAG: hypothetical protein GXP59_09890 [Deltaproteobacteria bacterium]|nr:hypothetical protein [Deltaproteobacteria bacterium]